MVEKISYNVIKSFPSFEIRSYPPLLVASINVVDEDISFRKLFNYISGKNQSRKKIAMTSPVLTSEKIPMTSPVLSKGNKMMFALPKLYTEKTVPQPLDSDISIDIIPKRIVAVLRFRGISTKKLIDKQKIILMDSILKEQYIPHGEVFLMRYNSPFMPGFFRRNEIAIEIIKSVAIHDSLSVDPIDMNK